MYFTLASTNKIPGEINMLGYSEAEVFFLLEKDCLNNVIIKIPLTIVQFYI